MSHSIPPTDHFEEFLRLVELVATLRILANDRTLDPDDAMRCAAPATHSATTTK